MAWFVCPVFTKDGYREEVERLMARGDLFRHALFIPAPEPVDLLRSRYERVRRKHDSFSGFLISEYGYEYDEKAGCGANGSIRKRNSSFSISTSGRFGASRHSAAGCAISILARRAMPSSCRKGEWRETEQFFRVGDGAAPPVDYDSPYERALDENLFATRGEYYI